MYKKEKHYWQDVQGQLTTEQPFETREYNFAIFVYRPDEDTNIIEGECPLLYASQEQALEALQEVIDDHKNNDNVIVFRKVKVYGNY